MWTRSRSKGLESPTGGPAKGHRWSFCTGFVGDSREWRRQIEDLSDEFTVVAWDALAPRRDEVPHSRANSSANVEAFSFVISTGRRRTPRSRTFCEAA